MTSNGAIATLHRYSTLVSPFPLPIYRQGVMGITGKTDGDHFQAGISGA
ncbi:hypothetical protein [Phormidium sp. CCY1219]|nr:hypothetical protein [Phormidium sp. CCY1219]